MKNNSLNEIEYDIEILDKDGTTIKYDVQDNISKAKSIKTSIFNSNTFIGKAIKTLLLIFSSVVLFIFTKVLIISGTILALVFLLFIVLTSSITKLISRIKRR